ncbi:MAG: ComF family protein [Vallitaleaceae bacterium]|nr:ComF family protein [Vallitaleaceae bacterium]
MINSFKNWIFPTKCVFCEKKLSNPKADLCELCYTKVSYLNQNYCHQCGKQRNESEDLCYDCRSAQHRFVSGRGMFVYDEILRKSLYGLKFYNKTWVGRVLGKMAADFHLEEDLPMVDLVIPVPLHFSRRIRRGYNQAEIMAKEFSKVRGIPYEEVLLRTKYTLPQKELTPTERFDNLVKAIRIKKSKGNSLKGKKILLMDDIYTTGATINSCSEVLLNAGAKEVFFLVAAIGNGL